MNENELIPHLFRTEYAKITAVLCRRFGFEHIEIAEDIVSETFLSASETWGIRGLPDKPLAWLYAVAKNKAKNHLRHNDIFRLKVVGDLSAREEVETFDLDLSSRNISDSLLQMLFAVCHPVISSEAQISLALRVLCGLGVHEIADAFLIPKETVAKRLLRAKEIMRSHQIKMEFPPEELLHDRLDNVLTTLYLLFSEGYYSISNSQTIRKELCLEAMRLTFQLVDNPSTDLPAVHALLALMSFQASRFEARLDDRGQLVLYDEQDKDLWDMPLIRQGEQFLTRSFQGNRSTRFHLEAGIAYWHTQKENNPRKWENILILYNELLSRWYSPAAALNRTYALSRVRGKAIAITEAEKINLTENHLYFVLLGSLYSDLDNDKARCHFEKAIELAKTPMDKTAIVKLIEKIK